MSLPWAAELPETKPISGVYQTFMGVMIIKVSGEPHQIAKLQDGTIRPRNNVGRYLPCSTRYGTTFAGRKAVRGTYNLALMDLALWRLLMGYEDGYEGFDPNLQQRSAALPANLMATNVIPADDVTSQDPTAPGEPPYRAINFYPAPVDIVCKIGQDVAGNSIGDVRTQFLHATMCYFNSGAVTFRQDAMVMHNFEFIGSQAVWYLGDEDGLPPSDLSWIDWS